MAIPFPTTTIALLAPASANRDEDWGTAPDPESGYSPVESGVNAHFSTTGAGASTGQATPQGNTETIRYELLCDPCGLRADMRVHDERTGLDYDVAWVMPRPEPLSHLVASVSRSTATS